MSPEEVTAVLVMVSAAEGRPVDEAMIAFWTATLAVHRITQDEFRRAVVQHYAESTYPIRPGHVWAIIQPGRHRERVERSLRAEQERSHQFLMAEIAERHNDWSAYDARYPGHRKAQVERELEGWSEHATPACPMPQVVRDQAVEFGLLTREVEQ